VAFAQLVHKRLRGVFVSRLDQILPRVHVEAGIDDVDAELDEFTAESGTPAGAR
jgi:hypothetical protein